MATKTITSSNWTGKIRITYTASNGTLKITEIEGTKTDSARSWDELIKSISVKVGSVTKTIKLSHYVDFPASGTWKAWGATDTSWTGITVTNPSFSTTMPSPAPSGSSLQGAKFSGNLTMSFNTYSITYDANGGTGAPSKQTKTHGTDLKLSTTKPTRAGYTFLRWVSTRSNGSTVNYQPGDSVTYEGNQTLVAQWSENYLTVNYYSNYATSFNGTYTALNTVNNNNVKIYTVQYYYDNSYSNGLLNYDSGSSLGMLRTGHTLTGNWGTSTSGGTLVNHNTSFASGQALAAAFGKSISSGSVSINVYAQWKANTYTITYNANGGTDAPAEQIKTHGVALTLSGDVPTRSGYAFLGWSTSSSSTSPTYYAGGSFTSNSNTTLYAVWEASGEKTIISLNKKIAKLTDGIRLNFDIKNSTNKHTIVWTSGSNSLTSHTNNSLSSGTFEYLLSEARFASWFSSSAAEINVTVTVTTYNSTGINLGTSSASFTLIITEELGKPSIPVATVTNKTTEGATITLTKPTFKYNATFAEWIATSNIGEVSISGDIITINVDSNINQTGVTTIQAVDSRGFLSNPVNIIWRVRKKDVCVFDNTFWSSSTPYVYVDGQWRKCGHAIYDNFAWISDGIKIDLVDKYLLTSEGYSLLTSDMLYLKGKKG